MAELNLLRGKYDGKLGQTVGANWKGIATVHALNPGKDPNTKPQQQQRKTWLQNRKWIAEYGHQIKPYLPLDCSKMTYSNALMHRLGNNFQWSDGHLRPDLTFAKGNDKIHDGWSINTRYGYLQVYPWSFIGEENNYFYIAVGSCKDGNGKYLGCKVAIQPITEDITYYTLPGTKRCAVYYWQFYKKNGVIKLSKTFYSNNEIQ